ncbi:hypothetical protein [Tunicatimonas pelagia]|uniref:hypothetical protein n=1 Tax=Tunicatimonas pelagia TaxID=931531 RepID=UPI002665DE30|nr:hypothetical protein [Tunicatimonas pelagia]WKN40547.1 hypothetical protein P0M28_16025 [Tunicatimonas pelagia]
MNDIEKLFKEKLSQHPVAPPPGVWEKLERTQVQKKKKGAWWWMAASVVFLLLAGVTFVFTQQPTTTNDTVAIELPKVGSETLETVTAKMPKPLPKNLPKVIEPTPVAETRLATTVITQKTDPEESTAEIVQRLASIDKVKTTSPQEPQYTVNQLPETDLIADASARAKTAVTIIYKSGKADESVEEEPKKPLRKAIAFLADIKYGGVGFSELRSAKSEIISKAFTNKREPMAGE